MTQSPMHAWWNLCTAGWTTALRVAETMTAAHTVVASRVDTMQAAARDPLNGDYTELSRMVMEKAEAFGEAAASIARDMQSSQLQAIAMLADAGRIGKLGDRSAKLARHNAGIAGRALAPVHGRATANARRLRKKPRR